jgi:hypothetical protein
MWSICFSSNLSGLAKYYNTNHNKLMNDFQVVWEKFNKANISTKIFAIVLILGAMLWGFRDAMFRNIWIPANTEIELIVLSPSESYIAKPLFIKGHKVIDESNFAILVPNKTADEPFTKITVLSNFFDQLTFTLDEPLSLEEIRDISNPLRKVKAHNRYNIKLEKAETGFIRDIDKDSFDIIRRPAKIASLKIQDRVRYNFYKLVGSKQLDINDTIVQFTVTDNSKVNDLSIETGQGLPNSEFNRIIEEAIAMVEMPKLNKELVITMQFGLTQF